MNLPSPFGTDGLAIRCITALPHLQQNRSERDSNPRTREDQRFSRPPQYDRFGIAPIGLINIITFHESVNTNMKKTADKSVHKG